MLVKCSHCILGTGFTSMIASYLLKQQGIDAFQVGPPAAQSLFNLEVADSVISPLPIFPVKHSWLYGALKLGDLFPSPALKVEDSGVSEYRASDYQCLPNSFAEFIWNGPGSSKRFALSIKHWGPSILTQPFLQVQNKINRTYLPGMANERIGYLNGHSLYNHFIKKLTPNRSYTAAIHKIDYERKIVHAGSTEIHFGKLISTIPINILLAGCGLHLPARLSFDGAYFFYFSHTSPFPANRIIYDFDICSSVIRLISITDWLLAVQLPTYKKETIEVAEIVARVKELVPLIVEMKFEKEYFIPMSYPIEPVNDEKVLEKKEQLIQNSILPFGRFGNWEYSDLHELEWQNIF